MVKIGNKPTTLPPINDPNLPKTPPGPQGGPAPVKGEKDKLVAQLGPGRLEPGDVNRLLEIQRGRESEGVNLRNQGAQNQPNFLDGLKTQLGRLGDQFASANLTELNTIYQLDWKGHGVLAPENRDKVERLYKEFESKVLEMGVEDDQQAYLGVWVQQMAHYVEKEDEQGYTDQMVNGQVRSMKRMPLSRPVPDILAKVREQNNDQYQDITKLPADKITEQDRKLLGDPQVYLQAVRALRDPENALEAAYTQYQSEYNKTEHLESSGPRDFKFGDNDRFTALGFKNGLTILTDSESKATAIVATFKKDGETQTKLLFPEGRLEGVLFKLARATQGVDGMFAALSEPEKALLRERAPEFVKGVEDHGADSVEALHFFGDFLRNAVGRGKLSALKLHSREPVKKQPIPENTRGQGPNAKIEQHPTQ